MNGTHKLNQTFSKSFDAIPESTFNKIVMLFHRSMRPLFLGQVSMDIGWSLERTEMMINCLIGKGVLRHASLSERTYLGVDANANIFALVEKPSLVLATW